jgi:alkyl hydroperoxide reductase subunit AhpF
LKLALKKQILNGTKIVAVFFADQHPNFDFMDNLKADKILVDKLKSLPNVSIVTNARTSQVLGDGGKVIGLEYENRENKLHA